MYVLLTNLSNGRNSHADLELPEEFPSQSTLISASESHVFKGMYERAWKHVRHAERKEGFDKVMEENNLDSVAIPIDSPICTMAAASGQ